MRGKSSARECRKVFCAALMAVALASAGLAARSAAAAPTPTATAPAATPSTTRGTQAPGAVCSPCPPFRIFRDDARAVFTAPLQWQRPEWRSAMRKALVVAGAMALVDASARDRVQEQRTASTDRIADAFEPFGNRYAAGVLLGYGLAGWIGDRPASRSVAMDGASSVAIAAGLIVPAFKKLTGRSRPWADAGASDFHPLNGGESFPSGHTAAAFALAGTVAAHAKRRWIKGLAYGVASMVAYSRVESDAHFVSDVAAGAMIGVGVAKQVASVNATRAPRGMHPRRRARKGSQSAPPPPPGL